MKCLSHFKKLAAFSSVCREGQYFMESEIIKAKLASTLDNCPGYTTQRTLTVVNEVS